MGGEKPFDPEKMRRMNHEARELAKILDSGLQGKFGERMGFTLFVFSFDGSELTYISNANRQDMKKAILEWLHKLDTGEATMPSEQKN